MIGLIIGTHIITCIFLIGMILIQAGRGGGLIETFSGIESMFGQKTNAFLTRTTTILSILFFITCLSLALLSAHQSRSLMKDAKPEGEEPAQTAGQAQPQAQAPQTQAQGQTEAAPEAQEPQTQTQEAPKTE